MKNNENPAGNIRDTKSITKSTFDRSMCLLDDSTSSETFDFSLENPETMSPEEMQQTINNLHILHIDTFELHLI